MPIWSFSKKNKSVNVRSSDGPSRAVGAVAAIGQLSLSSDTTASKYKYGVQTLYDPGSEVAVFDIVFVHGLTGSRLSTWTSKESKTVWPKTLLSNNIPNARILTLGYDADVVNYWAPASQKRVKEHAKDLNNALCDLRDTTNTVNRPIIFVAHSLGGIVCKDALWISKNDEKPHIRDIYDSTIAIAFLGTPHRGANLANWAAWLGRYTNMLKKTNQDIINLLKPQSEVHDRINQDFHKMLSLQSQRERRPLEIICFFEELPVMGIGEIVPKDSAILLGYESRGIHSNHMDMTKFEDNNDPGYQSICAVLRRWIREYKESLTSNSNPATENTSKSHSNSPPWTSNQTPSINYSLNNTAGGMVIEGNNINSAGGPIHFGR